MALLLGLDVGTGGARALAVDAEGGGVVAEAATDYPLATPRPGWTEQDPADWAEAALAALAAVARGRGDEVAAVGLAGQMHGSVFLDGADRVIRPALLWNDQRTAAQAQEIDRLMGDGGVVDATGNPALTGFQAPKIMWLRQAEPEAYARVASVLLPKDYVRLALTGEKATDFSDASGTLLLDVAGRRWSQPVLDALELDPAWLPGLREGTEVAGALTAAAAQRLGVPAGLPVAAGGGDNAAAAVGVGVVEPGTLSVSIGTSGVLFAPTAGFAPDPSGRVHAFCHAVPGGYHDMAVTLAAGASLSWWRTTVGAASFDELVDEAADVEPGARGLVFLPYLSGERTPHLDPAARGGFVGLTTGHGRAEMTRAVLEGVVFSLRDGLEIMRAAGVEAGEARAVGGGSRSALWRRLQADVLGLPIRRMEVDEGPAYGAALLAGVACGQYASVAEAVERVALDPDVTEPGESYDEQYAVYRSLYAPLRESMHALAELAA